MEGRPVNRKRSRRICDDLLSSDDPLTLVCRLTVALGMSYPDRVAVGNKLAVLCEEEYVTAWAAERRHENCRPKRKTAK